MGNTLRVALPAEEGALLLEMRWFRFLGNWCSRSCIVFMRFSWPPLKKFSTYL
jgi:hypothetical protein